MRDREPRWLILFVLVLVGIAAYVARTSYDVNRSQDPRDGEWVSLEPDSFYHMRRVERALIEGGGVAGTDPILDYPDGAEIPWPPYYAQLLTVLAGWTVGDLDSAGAHLEIEQLVASMPLLFGCLTALLAALAAYRLGGSGAGALAGIATATALGSVLYSSLGNGDHHAFVAMLHLALLFGLSLVLETGALKSPKRAACIGVLLGALVGVGLGSWVAFMAYVVEIELILAALLFQHARRPIAGLPAFGFALHLSALLVLMPAVVASPWQAVQPWSVINISFFHPFFLLVGASVFVPLLLPGKQDAWRRQYPWLVGGVLALLFGALFASGAGPGVGLREAFSWASREDQFMASILESASILDDFASGSDQLLLSVGWLIALLPLALIAALVVCVKGKHALLPWLIATPLLLLQTLSQLRFSESLVAPAAVLVAWLFAHCFRLLPLKGTKWMAGAAALGLSLGLLLQVPALGEMARFNEASALMKEPTEMQQRLGATRRLCDWLRGQPVDPGAAGVLASWGDGHMIEWAAGRPTVATNFGSYLGAESYAFGPRAFLSEDPAEFERLLHERQIGHVLLSSRLPDLLPDLVQRSDPSRVDDFLVVGRDSWKGGLRPGWFGTTMARLLFAGSRSEAELPNTVKQPFGFLRLIHVAPELDPQPALGNLFSRVPRGWVWQVVRGAELVFHGSPGSEVGVRFEVRYPDSGIRLKFELHATVGADGLGHLRVPYATGSLNGDGRVLPGATYWIGAGASSLEIPEVAVTTGQSVDLY